MQLSLLKPKQKLDCFLSFLFPLLQVSDTANVRKFIAAAQKLELKKQTTHLDRDETWVN